MITTIGRYAQGKRSIKLKNIKNAQTRQKKALLKIRGKSKIKIKKVFIYKKEEK